MSLRCILLLCCILAVVSEEPTGPSEEKRALGGLIPCPTCKRYTKAWDRFVDSFTPFWHGRADDVLKICKERAPERTRRCKGATTAFKKYVLSIHEGWKQGSNMCKAIFPCADHIPGKAGLEKTENTTSPGPDGVTNHMTFVDASDDCRACMAAYDGVYALEENEFVRIYEICLLAMGSEDEIACEALIPVSESNNAPSGVMMCMDMGMCSGFPTE